MGICRGTDPEVLRESSNDRPQTVLCIKVSIDTCVAVWKACIRTLLWPLEADIEFLPRNRLVCTLSWYDFCSMRSTDTVETGQSACCVSRGSMGTGECCRLTIVINKCHFVVAHHHLHNLFSVNPCVLFLLATIPRTSVSILRFGLLILPPALRPPLSASYCEVQSNGRKS